MTKSELASISKEAHLLSKSLASADKRLTAYLQKYSPDQPRDARGRFASTGAAGAVSGGGRILTPANSPSWWPTASRDLLVIGAVGTAIGLAPVVGMAGKGLHRQVLRGMGPVAYRMAQRFGGHVSGHFQSLARMLGFKVPRTSLRGVPRKYTQRAWDRLPPDVKHKVDRIVTNAKGKLNKPGKPTKPIAGKPKGTTKPRR